MKQTTAILKRLQVSPFEAGQATVTLDGQEIGRIEREPTRRNWYWSTVEGRPWGGGKTITNATKAIAVGYCCIKQLPD
jgi:hypothetical protein